MSISPPKGKSNNVAPALTLDVPVADGGEVEHVVADVA